MSSGPIQFLLGENAARLGARPIPGLTLVETGRGEVAFHLAGEPERAGPRGTWRYREDNGALELTVIVERFDEFCAGLLRATVRNAGDQPRFLQYFQVRVDLDEAQARWKAKVCGGGPAIGTYPTPAYDVREYAFIGDSHLTMGTDADGRSSNKDLPLMIVTRSRDGESCGFWYGMEWSGEWYMTGSIHLADRRFRADAGIPVRQLRIEPGEELQFPAVHAGGFVGSAAAGTNALRRYLYQHLQPDYLGERPYPRVSYDHWFGLENAIDEAVLKRQVDQGAEIGVEMWCLDAGWFGDFDRDVGNWNAAVPRKFPNGLEPLAEYVRKKGMQFGLWFEPERAFQGTWAVQEHPEFFWPDPHGGPAHHLNLARRDAQDWLIELLSGWIGRLDLRWSRYDCNIAPSAYWRAADPTVKIQLAYCAGLYRVLDELRWRHPEWMIENCASGGRRIDLGTLARTHTNWFSDYTHGPHTCRWMQLRCQQFLSANAPNSSVALWRDAGDPVNIDHEILSRATGKLSFDGDIASLSLAATKRCRHWVKAYKEYRHLLVQDFWQLTPVPRTPSDWDVAQWSVYDASEGLLAAYRVEGADTWRGPLQGMDAGASYKLTNLGGGRSRTIAGAQLQEKGFKLKLPPHSAALWHWQKL